MGYLKRAGLQGGAFMTTIARDQGSTTNADRIPSNRPGVADKSAAVSVVIPAYRSRDSLPILIERLEAVLSRFGQDFEIIVVDDGSPDDTWEVLKKLKPTFPR